MGFRLICLSAPLREAPWVSNSLMCNQSNLFPSLTVEGVPQFQKVNLFSFLCLFLYFLLLTLKNTFKCLLLLILRSPGEKDGKLMLSECAPNTYFLNKHHHLQFYVSDFPSEKMS